MTHRILLGGDQVTWPAEAKPPWRGLYDLAHNIAALMDDIPRHGQARGRGPDFPILITGDWGTGKTTLLKGIQHFLDAADPRPGATSRTIWFDAWRHEGEGVLLPALVRAVWDALPAELHQRQDMQSLGARILNLATHAALRGAPTLAGLLGGLLGGPVTGAATGAATQAVTAMVSGLTVKNLTEMSEQGARVEGPPQGDPMDQLRSQLGRLLEEGWARPTSEGAAPGVDRLPVVFIDDLDRCDPDQAVRLLDQIRALLAHGAHLPCHFVVAMDRQLLTLAITRKFHGLDGYDGNRYLEKMFPLAFAVPGPARDEATSLVSRFFSHAVPDARQRDPNELHSLTDVLVQPVFANPRLMRRCIDRFGLVRRFEAGEGPLRAGPTAADNSVLAEWIAATERWPALRRLMVLHEDSYWERVGQAAKGAAEAPGPDVAELLRQRGAREWLVTKVFAGAPSRVTLLRRADERLRRWGL